MENQEYKVKQIGPNHADHISYYNEKYLDEMLNNEAVIAQPKYDGERMLIHFNNGEAYCTSRRHSKKTDRFMENQDKLPILQTFAKKLKDAGLTGYTILDCECYSKDWSTIVGILHSLPERALELQQKDEVKFAVFDCLFFNGQDVRDEMYVNRLKYMNLILDLINDIYLHSIEFMSNEGKLTSRLAMFFSNRQQIQESMDAAIAQGFEGIVVKSLNRKYYDKGASLKCKKFETVDCVVYDYQQGRGKYENTVGALLIGYYDKDKDTIVHLSKVNCGTDEDRDWWYEQFKSNDVVRKVIEVKCQEVTDRSLRHPVYIRRRDDKEYAMCTKDTIFKGEHDE